MKINNDSQAVQIDNAAREIAFHMSVTGCEFATHVGIIKHATALGHSRKIRLGINTLRGQVYFVDTVRSILQVLNQNQAANI